MKAKRRALIPALLSGILALGLLARSSTRLAMDLLYPFSTADTTSCASFGNSWGKGYAVLSTLSTFWGC